MQESLRDFHRYGLLNYALSDGLIHFYLSSFESKSSEVSLAILNALTTLTLLFKYYIRQFDVLL